MTSVSRLARSICAVKAGNIISSKPSCRWKHRFTVTTPIFYCNASPHIGHLYTVVIADAVKRYHELLDDVETHLVTGTDEHGTKIQQAAAANQMLPSEFCDKVSAKYKQLFDSANIHYTHFIRTTDEHHVRAVQHFWDQLASRGYIYGGKYSGWYCISDEAFLTESEVKELPPKTPGCEPVKVSVESGRPVEWTEEDNFMFKLSSFRDDLLHWLKNDDVVKPAKFHKLLLHWLNEAELGDLSLSRPRSRVSWGIPVPNNPGQTVYVWLDALVNYLTAAGYPHNDFKEQWPPTMQILGKDILKFHGIYWPAFLIGAGLEPPAQLIVHSHWTVDGEKMSKSRDNVVNPLTPRDGGSLEDLAAMRYFLLRTGTLHSDNNYSKELMEKEVNADLADALGNLLNRCSGMAINPQQEYPALPLDQALPSSTECHKLMAAVEILGDKVQPHYESCNFYMGIKSIRETIHLANEFFSAMVPWKLTREERNERKQMPTVHVTMEALRVCGIALQPIVPNIAATLLDRLGIPQEERKWRHMRQVSWKGGHSERGYRLHPEHCTLVHKLGIREKVVNTVPSKKMTHGKM